MVVLRIQRQTTNSTNTPNIQIIHINNKSINKYIHIDIDINTMIKMQLQAILIKINKETLNTFFSRILFKLLIL